MDLSTDPSTGLSAGTVPITPHLILDQITEKVTATPTATILITDRATMETTIETEDTSITQDMTKGTKVTRTGMITIKIGIGLTTEDNQTNFSTSGTSQKCKSSSKTQIRTY